MSLFSNEDCFRSSFVVHVENYSDVAEWILRKIAVPNKQISDLRRFDGNVILKSGDSSRSANGT